MVIAQPMPKGPDTPVVSSAMDPSIKDGPTTMNRTVFDAPPS